MLAARPAAEIVTGNDDLRAAIRLAVQYEIGNFLAILREAHLVEQVRTQPRPLDGLQELLRDDHIGVDIEDVERRGDAGQLVKFLHDSLPAAQPWNSRISVR